MYVVYTKHLKPSRTNIICSFRPTFILRLLFKEPQPAATSRRVHFPLPHSLPPSRLSLSVRHPLAFYFSFSFFVLPAYEYNSKSEWVFFSLRQLHLYPRLLHFPFPYPFPCGNTTQPPQSHPQCEKLYFFLWRRRLSYGSFAALSSMLLNFNYCYIFHTLRVLNATCCKLQAACCVVLRRRGDDKHVKCQMGNGKLWKCQMPNGKWSKSRFG